jgi:hypothetical protein
MPAPVLQVKRGALSNLPGLRVGEPAFTTDTFDFFVGIDSTTNNNKFLGSHRYWTKETSSTGSGVRFVERTDGGSNYIELKAPDTALAGNVTYVLPATQGSNSTVLTNDGSGNLSWGSGSNEAVFTGITTFSDTTDSTTKDNGSIIVEGGVGIEKSVNIGGNLSVLGVSTFSGLVVNNNGINVSGFSTIYTLQVSTSLNVGGTFDLDGYFSAGGESVFSGIASFTSSKQSTEWYNGAVVLDGGLGVGKNANIHGDLKVDGNVTIGGSFVSLRGQDVFIENKDLILGYTTSITPNDDTANHAGVAIASTEGSPLVPFAVSGINTLPDTYKQLMWFKSGTLGFSTDTFAFNYGLAIGTTSMANGVRLAVGSSISMTDTTITAPAGNFTDLNVTNITGSLTGTISTATRATTVDTTATSTNTNYHLVFTDNATSTNGATMRVDAGVYYNPSSNNLFASQFIGDLVAGTIKAADTTTAMTLANSTGNVTFNGDIQIGGNDIKASDGTTALTLSTSTGNVKTGGDLIAGSGYLASANGTRAMYMYDTSGDVGFQGKVISNSYRSSTNASDTLTFNDLDATFARGLNITGITTIGAGVGVTQFSGSVSTGTSASSVPTSKAVIDYVTSQVSDVDLTLGIDADTGGPSTVTTSQTLTIAGTINEVNTSVSGQTITVGLPDAVIVGTSLSAPTIKTNTIQSGNTGGTVITLNATDATFANNLTVNGNLYVEGSTTQVNTTSLTIEDRTIELGRLGVGQTQPTTTTWDLAVLFNYGDAGVAKTAGFVWEASGVTKRFQFTNDVYQGTEGSESDTNLPQFTVANFAPIEIGALWVTDCAGTSQVISCTGTERFLENITVDAGTF